MKNRTASVALGASAALGLFAALEWRGILRADGLPAPNPLYYAGHLQDGATAVDGKRTMQITLWGNATPQTGEMPLCRTDAPDTDVKAGRFRVALNSTCKAVATANPNVWVEVVVNGGSFGRTAIGAVPYAVEAERAVAAGGALAQKLDAFATRIAALEAKAGEASGAVVPPGTVAAFDLDACPSGWVAFQAARGRVLVGTDAALARGTLVGNNAVALTAAQLPAHKHDVDDPGHAHAPLGTNFVVAGGAGAADISQAGKSYNFGGVTGTAKTGISVKEAGEGQAFDNRQASVALLFCRKS